jgi:hypothetical protein
MERVQMGRLTWTWSPDLHNIFRKHPDGIDSGVTYQSIPLPMETLLNLKRQILEVMPADGMQYSIERL